MTDTIKFREQRARINNMLAQLSGLAPLTQSRVTILFSLYKEIELDLTEGEKNEAIRLFGETKKNENMFSVKEPYSHSLDYYPRIEILNVVELYLRQLLGKYGYYELTKDNKDYQIGVE